MQDYEKRELEKLRAERDANQKARSLLAYKTKEIEARVEP